MDVKKTKLEEYIENLLREGKRSQHDDFQILFRLLPKKKDEIVKIAKDILERDKNSVDEK